MNSRIKTTLSRLKQKKQKAFIPYITAGYPNLKITEKIITTLANAGVSLIELGVPFTDPMADGPVIQKANELALKKGITLKKILSLVKKVRQKTQIPILLMGYYNPLFKYGIKKFVTDAVHAGVDGILVVDLPPEEAQPLKDALKGHPVDLIYLLTPTSDISRIKLVQRQGSGFVYYVSMTGVTGAHHWDLIEIKKNIQKIKRHIKLPINIGFGISKPEHVSLFAPIADGVIVGSSIINIISTCRTEKQIIDRTTKFVQKMLKEL